MRRKSEVKKQEIIKAASEIFKEFGFEKASMSKICSRVGGSKTTIYNYFSSKEELFFEVISIANIDKFDYIHEPINTKEEVLNLQVELYEFGTRFLNFIYSPKLKKLRRLTISKSGITNLGQLTYNSRILKSREILAAYLDKAILSMQIRKTDTMIASKHLYGLLESELMYQFLYQVDIEFSKEEMDAMAQRAIDVFIAAYGSKSSS